LITFDVSFDGDTSLMFHADESRMPDTRNNSELARKRANYD
jgi:hypothetical protein